MEFIPDEPAPSSLKPPKVGPDEIIEVYGILNTKAVILIQQKKGTSNSKTIKSVHLPSQDVKLATQLLDGIRNRHVGPNSDISLELKASDHPAVLKAAETRGCTLVAEVRVKPIASLPPRPEGITHRAMHPDELQPYLDRTEKQFGEEVLAGSPDPTTEESKQAAKRHARTAMERVVPQGGETPGHSFIILIDGKGEKVAELWVFLDEQSKRSFCYNIEVAVSKRRMGFGRKMLLVWEYLAAEQGATTLGLNVFAKNTVARNLYISSGFELEVAAVRIDA